ncbi:MAG: methyltransferase domain-containing protein [Dehalococcoidia bacterium]
MALQISEPSAFYGVPWTQAELALAHKAIALGASDVGGPLSKEEQTLTTAAAHAFLLDPGELRDLQQAIHAGLDPLGDGLILARPQTERRLMGQVFTPGTLIGPMVEWLIDQRPTRVVDAGCGSGRFALAMGRQSKAEVLAIDNDPVATLLTRASLAILGVKSARVFHGDYTNAELPVHEGKTAFVGNPPYVRHHNLTPKAKAWAQAAARRLGVGISGLAGLHAYFFLATALHGRLGDVGCFVTSSEWLDVNYGEVIRQLLLDGLGGRSIHVVDAKALPFDSAATTAAITCFELGSKPTSIKLRLLDDTKALSPLTAGNAITRERLQEAQRWMPLIRTKPRIPEGYVELGELCRVHRGTVTGANAIWVLDADAVSEIPERYLLASVTRARELITAGTRLERAHANSLRRVIDLPKDLDELDRAELPLVEGFLKHAKAQGVAEGYVAQNRKAWWSVGMRDAAPILGTYMARRAPAFVRNIAEARHINIAHGIYPREPMPQLALDRLAAVLRDSVDIGLGRTYSGGLVKFEPREMERIPVPSLERLLDDASEPASLG